MSKFEHHIGSVTHFWQKGLQHLGERRRAAEENQGVLTWWRHVLLNHLLSHETNSLSPLSLGRGPDIDGEVDLEVVSVVAGKLLELFVKQDVINRAVAKKHRVLDSILVAKRRLQHVEAGSNPSSTCEIADVGLLTHLLALGFEVSKAEVLNFAPWSCHVDGVANLESLEILCHLAAFWESWMDICAVDFDHKVDEALPGHVRNRCVLAVLLSAVDNSLKHNMPTDRKPEGHLRIWKPKPENKSVVRDLNLLGKNKSNEAIFIFLESLKRTSFLGNSEHWALLAPCETEQN